MSNPPQDAVYLGDGVYASFENGSEIWLRTPRADAWHEIALEPDVFRALLQFAQKLGGAFTP